MCVICAGGDTMRLTGTVMGEFVYHAGNFARAEALLHEGLALFKELGDQWGIALALRWLGILAGTRGEFSQAAALQEESLALNREPSHQAGLLARKIPACVD